MPSCSSVQVVLFGIGAVALGVAINVANGTLTPDSLEALTVACAAVFLAFAASCRGRDEAPRSGKTMWPLLILALGLAYEVGFVLVTPPLLYGRFRPGDAAAFTRAVTGAAVLAGALAFAPRSARRALLCGLVALHAAIGLWAIHASPEPHIDVFYFQRDSCAALLRAANPYTITFPNIYGDSTPFYGSHLSAHGRLQFGFIYPPLSLFLAIPGYLLGDFRYSQLFAIEASAILMALTRDEPAGALAAALFLLTPRSFFVLEQGWTEPYAVLLLAATVFAACRAPRALPYVLGLFLCVKQYLVLAVIPSVLLAPWRDARALRAFVIRAALTAAAVTLPLALWDPRAFWFDVAGFQLRQPLRADALSYLAWLARERPASAPLWLSFPLAGAIAALAVLRFPRTPAAFGAAIAAVFLVFFSTSKQAFANYYFFVIGAMCCAISAEGLRPSARPRAPRPKARRDDRNGFGGQRGGGRERQTERFLRFRRPACSNSGFLGLPGRIASACRESVAGGRWGGGGRTEPPRRPGQRTCTPPRPSDSEPADA